MKIHPEMRDVMNAEMTKELRLYAKKTPQEIADAVRARMVKEQATLLNVGKLGDTKRYELAATWCRTECKCRSFFMGPVHHLPWCEGIPYMMFTNVEIRQEPTPDERRKSAFKNWMRDHNDVDGQRGAPDNER